MTHNSSSSTFSLGITIALIILIIDQFSKYWLMNIYALPMRGTVEMLPFFNLVTVWNTGVSFGMLNQLGTSNANILIAFAGGLTVTLSVWLYRTQHMFLARALGLIIGGAVANIIDRIRFGAVFDFIDIHAYGYHWPAFNVADAAICVGVVLILVDGFLCTDNTDSSSPS